MKATLKNDTNPIMEQVIQDLTSLAIIFGENLPDGMLDMIKIPDDTDTQLYYRFINKAVQFFSKIKGRNNIKDIFNEMLTREKELVSKEILNKELTLFKENQVIIQNHFNRIMSNKSLKLKAAMEDVSIKGMLLLCKDICSATVQSNVKMTSIENLESLLIQNSEFHRTEALRTLLSFLIQRIIPNSKNDYERDKEVRKKIAELIAKININFFNNNRAIWVRLNRYAEDEEKEHIITAIGYDPF